MKKLVLTAAVSFVAGAAIALVAERVSRAVIDRLADRALFDLDDIVDHDICNAADSCFDGRNRCPVCLEADCNGLHCGECDMCPCDDFIDDDDEDDKDDEDDNSDLCCPITDDLMSVSKP